MDADPLTRTDRRGRALNGWLVAVALMVAPVAAFLVSILWQTPYPVSEGVALLEDVDPWSFDFLLPGRVYYRPLFFLSLFAAWHGTGSPAAFVPVARLLMVVPLLLLLGLFLVRLRPRNATDAAAATLACAVLMGSGAFLDNAEIPLTYTTVGMPVLLAAWMLTERARGPAPTTLFVMLAVLAIGFKEQGLVILPVVVVAWWLGAPGVGRVSAAATVAVGVAYVALRFAAGRQWAPFEQTIGYGFSILSPEEAAARFGTFPVTVYAYNVASTVSNLLLAEPTAGVFSITRAMVRGEAQPWQYVHLLSSACVTALIVWWAVRSLKRVRAEGWSEESRTIGVLVIALLASGALSFNYSRDRLGGMALVPYAVAAFYAARTALGAVTRAGVLRAVALTGALVLLAAAWQSRVLHMLDGACERAADNHREWITDLHERRVAFSGRPEYLRILEALADQGRVRPAARPLRYPSWVHEWLGEW